MQFVLDTPSGNSIKRVTRFSGWCLSSQGQPAREIRLSVNGEPTLRLIGSQRPDVAVAFPDQPFARNAAFLGDLVLPEVYEPGMEVIITIEVVFSPAERKPAYKGAFLVEEAASRWPARTRNYDLIGLLQNPFTGQSYRSASESQSHKWSVIAGTPHFHRKLDLPSVRLLEDAVTHPWGAQARQLISELGPDDLFLDFGAGIKRSEELRPNVVLLDAIHFTNVDVVATSDRIPFKENSFSFVISQAVFEHVRNPFRSAEEIFRVLKPGGKVLIDTAFMVPFHADPDHYFNMTIEGLRIIMESFEILQLGVQPHQMPSDGLIMQVEAVLPLMKAGVWRGRLETLLDELRREGRNLDHDLGPLGQRIMAAGVSVTARKPAA